MVLEYLKIQVAMRIDESRRNRQPATVDHMSIDGCLEGADPLYALSGDQDVTGNGCRPRAVDYSAALEDNIVHVNLTRI